MVEHIADIVNFELKTNEKSKAKSIVLLIFHGALITGDSGVARSCRKSHLGPAEIASFSSQDFSRNNKHDTF